MLRAWPLLFFIVPLIEIYFLIQVGEQIGAWMTILIVILTAIAGVSLLREQGLRTLMRASQRMQSGEMPAQEMFDGFILAAAGILLLTPGFFTDAFGFLLLVPAIRQQLMKSLLRNMVVQSYSQTTHHYHTTGGEPNETQPNRSNSQRTIDGEFRRED